MAENVGSKVFPNLHLLEFVWTLFPAVILLAVGLPRIIILYSYDVESRRGLSIKVVGHQWYWSYDLRDFPKVDFDSYIKATEDLNFGDFRLLETDNHCILPIEIPIRFVINSADVIHSWVIPRIALKVDANPGFLNRLNTTFVLPGLYYGQCSEICGANHSFMPVCIEATSIRLFKAWILRFYCN